MNRLYHEKQASALCGVHCLNTLLQRPKFTEVHLAEIALKLDEEERKVMQGEQWTESANVSNDGMFSIQVLQKALEPLLAIPMDHPDVRSQAKNHPEQENAFICNLQEHWFTIRSINGNWWNFNSLFPAPQPLGTFYLAAFIEETRAQGYDIFVVRGALPALEEPYLALEMSASHQGGRWLTVEESKQLNDEAASARLRGRAMNSIEAAFDRANAAGGGTTMTLRSSKRQRPGTGEDPMLLDDDEDPELAAAIAASLGQQDLAGPSSKAATSSMAMGSSSSSGARKEGGLVKAVGDADDEDADLMKAIALSLNRENPQGIVGALNEAGPSTSSFLPIGALPTKADSGGGNSSTGAAIGQDEVDQMMTGPFDEGEVRSGGGGGGQFEDDEDADLARAIAASLVDQGQTQEVAGPSSSSAHQHAADDKLDDEPEPGPDVISLAFNLPSIGRFQRLFLSTRDTPLSVYAFLRSTLKSKGEARPSSLMISRAYPRQELNEGDSRTLKEVGLSQSELLNVLRK